MISLSTLLLGALTVAAVTARPSAEKRTTQSSVAIFEPAFPLIPIANYTEVPYLEALMPATYFLTPPTGTSYPLTQKFTVITLESTTSSNTTGTLVYGYAGQSVIKIGLTEFYTVFDPAYAIAGGSYSLPSFPSNSCSVRLISYIFEEPTKTVKYPTTFTSRTNFDLTAYVAAAGLGEALGTSVIEICNGIVPKSCTAASTSTKSLSSSTFPASSSKSTASITSTVKSSASIPVSSTSTTSVEAVSSSTPASTTAVTSTSPSIVPTSTSVASSAPVVPASESATSVIASTTTSITTSTATSAATSSATSAATSAVSSTATIATCTLTAAQAAYATSIVGPDGLTYTNKGLVGMGVIDSNFVDDFGETLGGVGSAIALQRGTWQKTATGYSGTLVVQPDRGHNTDAFTDYNARYHLIDFTLTPYYCSESLNYNSTARETFALNYSSSVKYTGPNGEPTSGLDPLDVLTYNGVQYPVPSPSYSHLSADFEGLVILEDGTHWVSDEYGPFIYHYTAAGDLLETIVPPIAFLPFIDGELNFTSQVYPDTGRAPNQGFEGLTQNPDGTMLYAMLQSGLVQDGATSDLDGVYTRTLAFDISVSPAQLVSSYVILLPVTNGNGNPLDVSEIHYLSDDVFLALSRDAKGNGGSSDNSKHKDFLIYDVSQATNIAFTAYTNSTTPVAPGQVLVAGITAASSTEFISIIDETQLERFGMYNDVNFATDLIDAKWESIAIASALDDENPNDYFLFSVSDNDFITLDGYEAGAAYTDSYGSNVDTQALVWRITLPSADSGSNDSEE